MNASKVQIEFGDIHTRTPVSVEWRPPACGARADVIKLDFMSKPDDYASKPLSDRHEQLVESLARSGLYREFQRAFGEATGMPLTLRSVGGWRLAHAGGRHQNGFCALMSRSNRSCAACLQMQQRVCEGVNGVPCTLNCSFGITESAVGVKIGSEIIAYLQTGQVFLKPPTPAQTGRAVQQLKDWNVAIDRDEAARRYNETPVRSRSQYLATVKLLQFFADQLGALANQIVLQQKNAEPVQITRARQFIEKNYKEDLSLADVAREAGMSAFYFCKVFKKATGTNFTQYVSRVRVEKAKNLLLNLNFRISEIAFEVGFQSLTHFNRVFRGIAGTSPTEFRQQLPST
jgi:AraC-like DNA-binding protein/ligand-binding sensor protein